MENYCVMCGEPIPEGRHVCPSCASIAKTKDNFGKEKFLRYCVICGKPLEDECGDICEECEKDYIPEEKMMSPRKKVKIRKMRK